MTSQSRCPSCLRGRVVDGECQRCHRRVRLRRGVPSVTDRTRQAPRAEQLRSLASLVTGGTLERVSDAHRSGDIDASVVDRFFKRRTVGWRVLLEAHCAGRGLVLGDHDEVVPLSLAEVLDEVWTVDTDLASLDATAAVAAATGTVVRPLHADDRALPFPADSFDLVVCASPARSIPTLLESVAPLLAPDGRLAVLVDGWPRELGVAARLGVAPEPATAPKARLESAVAGLPAVLGRRLRRHDLTIDRSYALLSRGRHENELAFDADGDRELAWLLETFDATAADRSYARLRRLGRLGHRLGIVSQSYPRYLHVCSRSGGSGKRRTGAVAGERAPAGEEPVDADSTGVLVAGKNRTTLLELADGELVRLRKVPNGRRHESTNERAERATTAAATVPALAPAIPTSTTVDGTFGIERIESPVTGTPLDRLIDDRPDRLGAWLDLGLGWLERLQQSTRGESVELEPAAVTAALTADRFDRTEPPTPRRAVTVARVLTHGDFFGSNIYVEQDGDDRHVSGVIDWEWATVAGNPVVDSGYFALEIAAAVDSSFDRGFERCFVRETPASRTLYRRLALYADRMDLTPETVATFLPIGYLRRARADVRYNGRLDIDWPGRIERVWAARDEIRRRLARLTTD